MTTTVADGMFRKDVRVTDEMRRALRFPALERTVYEKAIDDAAGKLRDARLDQSATTAVMTDLESRDDDSKSARTKARRYAVALRDSILDKEHPKGTWATEILDGRAQSRKKLRERLDGLLGLRLEDRMSSPKRPTREQEAVERALNP